MSGQSDKSSYATVQLGVAKADGKAILADGYFSFEPFNKEFGLGPYRIAVSDITSVSKCHAKAAGIMPISSSAFDLHLRDGSHYQFIMADVDSWITALSS